MALYKPSTLRAFLEEIDAFPKKSLSQNFLIDGNIIRKIVTLAGVEPGDFVLEIGPGPGVLTEELLARGAHVLAVEKDRKFAKALTRLQTDDERLTVIEADILELDLSKLLKPKTIPTLSQTLPLDTASASDLQQAQPLRKQAMFKNMADGRSCEDEDAGAVKSQSLRQCRYKLVANLPYQITTPILTKFLPKKEFFESITVMVQKEVSARFIAKPSTKDYSSITVFVQFYSQPEFGFTVEPTCFYPPPRVKSAVVKFKLKDHPIVSSEEDFFAMTRRAFQQRRKMIRSSLKLVYEQDTIDIGLEKIGKGLQVRPENLSLADFLILSHEIHKKNGDLSTEKKRQ